jgi:hypothetical protein
MTNRFTYSILKYNHSFVLGESLNVGVLFSFEQDPVLHFVSGNHQRVKSIYPSFDANIFIAITKGIKRKLSQKTAQDLFPEQKDYSFKEYINTILLPEDSTSLQFSDPFFAINSFGTSQKAIEEFAKILLPDQDLKKDEFRHNETYILKKYTDYIAAKNINVDFRMRKNQLIEIKGLKMNFELSWKNGTVHLVKPISFDLKVEYDIQNKSAQYFGYLDLLTEYAKRNDYTFDLLIGKPQDKKLYNSYDDALYILDRTIAPKTLVTEEKLEEYSDATAEILHSKDS